MKKWVWMLLVTLLLLLSSACLAEEAECQFDLESYGGTLKMTFADGSEEETGGWGIGVTITKEGMTVGDAISGMDVVALEAVNENDIFEGWITFAVNITEDEDGFSEYEYVLASDEPISTEALMAQPLTENYTVYAAKWSSIPAEDYFRYEEEEAFIVMPSVTLYANGGAMLMHSEEEDYESSLNVATAEAGQLLGEVLELDNLLSVTREGYIFDGWTVYEVPFMETVEGQPEDVEWPCFEVFDGWYTVLHDAEVLHEGVDTTELKDMVFGEKDLFIAAQWK